MDSIVLQPLLYPPLPSELTRSDFRLEKLFAGKKLKKINFSLKRAKHDDLNVIIMIDNTE